MLVVFLIVFVDLVGFGIIIPLLPFYGEFFGASPAQVGLLMASYSLTQFLAAPLWGRLSDRVGRKPVLIVSLAGISLAYLWLAYADSLWMLFAARAVAGAPLSAVVLAFGTTQLPPGVRATPACSRPWSDRCRPGAPASRKSWSEAISRAAASGGQPAGVRKRTADPTSPRA